MNKNFILTATAAGFLLAGPAYAQDENTVSGKTKEIIIRKNGNKKTKMTIEIDGDNVTVNGEPMADYKDGEVRVIERDRVNRGSGNFLLAPDGGDWKMDIDEQVHRGGSSAFLGVMSDKVAEGAKITEIVIGSSAEKAGLREGDIITKVDNKPVADPESLMELIRARKPKEEVKINYLRSGKKNDVKVQLGENKQSRSKVFRFDNNNDRPHENFEFNMPHLKEMQPMEGKNFRYFFGDRAKLGVKVEDTEDNAGARVLEVTDASPAAKAGLMKDDIITDVNNEKVNGVDNLRSEINNREEGGNYKLKVMRNNKLIIFDVNIPKPKRSADL